MIVDVGLLRTLVPASLQTVDTFGDVSADSLFAEERAVVGRAVQKRRREFATVRHCARVALSRLGVQPGPILPGDSGAPGWPDGIVGSMTHCDGYRAAAVGWRRDVLTVGLDAEPHAPLPGDVLDLVTSAAERSHLAQLRDAEPAVCWDRLLFSAKESVYKAWFPVARRWLGFEEVDVVLDPAGTFVAQFVSPAEFTSFAGRWLTTDSLVITAIVVPQTLAFVPDPSPRS